MHFSWGGEGYIRLKKQSNAQWGTDSTPIDGTACVGGPGNDEQTVCGQCGVLFDNSYPLGAYAINWFVSKCKYKNFTLCD